jgi:phage shock protein E
VAVSQGDPNFVIIDVRTAAEFSAGHLQGAINIDYNGANFSQLLGVLPRDKPYLVYCGSGARSGASMATFLSLGFQAYYNMQGGIGAWRTAGYPTV